ncbi:MAG: hypothetical protein AB7K24_27900, partial [Gemmataceae bacterium]
MSQDKPRPDRERYPQEGYASDLHDQLNQEVAARLAGTNVSLILMGVNSYCEVARGPRSTTIYCFDVPGPQFLARFDNKPATSLWGRTFDRAAVICAVVAWLEGQPPDVLLEQFAFVEEHRRMLNKVEGRLLAMEPALAAYTTHEVTSTSASCDI